jgi:DNA-binding HxlR family transcriptional regulator
MKNEFRCNCPVTSALDVLGDKWILVIVKLMLMEEKRTFKDFMESDEGIATNVLSTRLNLLQEMGIVSKTKLPHNRKTNYYQLTERGISLTPLIVELAFWSDHHLRAIHPTIVNGEDMAFLRSDKAAFARLLEKKYREQLTLAELP